MRSPTLAELPPPPDAVTIWPWTRASPTAPPVMPDGSPWPLVSIVMPVFRQGRFLEQAIRSVLLQGYPRLELIVVDGGSPDDTRTILERYAPWLKYWVSEADRGPAHALNKGFAYAGGDLLGVLNGDDFFLPGCLMQVAESFAAHPEAGVISGHGYFATPDGTLGVPTFSDPWNLTWFCHGACVLVQPSTFFRRDAFERAGGFRENDRVCWDMELWAEMAATGTVFRSLDAFLAAFRLHADSITGRPELRHLRREHARSVASGVLGRPESAADRALHYVYRAMKFSRHPARTVRQRLFFYNTLGRWSL